MNNSAPLIVIPTYNERENIEKLYLEIRKLGIKFGILFIDDHSPDGSGEVIESLVRRERNIFAIHRPGKMGIGSAHLEGIAFAYKQKYDTLITMDCDFSHNPEYIPEFLRQSENFAIVVGSRYMNDNSLLNWSALRKFLTYLGHLLTKVVLRMPYDATGAYRLYRLDRIPKEVFGVIQSKGYSFFFESLYVLYVNQFSIKEVPIVLPARTYGHSKMSLKDVYRSLERLIKVFWTTTLNTKKYKIACLPEAVAKNEPVQSPR